MPELISAIAWQYLMKKISVATDQIENYGRRSAYTRMIETLRRSSHAVPIKSWPHQVDSTHVMTMNLIIQARDYAAEQIKLREYDQVPAIFNHRGGSIFGGLVMKKVGHGDIMQVSFKNKQACLAVPKRLDPREGAKSLERLLLFDDQIRTGESINAALRKIRGIWPDASILFCVLKAPWKPTVAGHGNSPPAIKNNHKLKDIYCFKSDALVCLPWDDPIRMIDRCRLTITSMVSNQLIPAASYGVAE